MLNVLEESMGQHVYVNRPVGNPLEIDFVDTTRRLSAVSRVLQVEKRTESQVAVVRLSLSHIARLFTIS